MFECYLLRHLDNLLQPLLNYQQQFQLTATNALKPATLETGALINVPLFINEGDKVKIDTEKGQYIERIK